MPKVGCKYPQPDSEPEPELVPVLLGPDEDEVEVKLPEVEPLEVLAVVAGLDVVEAPEVEVVAVVILELVLGRAQNARPDAMQLVVE